MGRLRRTANAEWGEEKYAAVLGAWLLPMTGTLEARWGPFVKVVSQVSASTLVRMLPVCEAFIDAGQRSAVLHGHRLEAAIYSIVSDNPHLRRDGELPQHCAHSCADHLLAVLKALRTMKSEEEQPSGSGRRRFSKTSSLRRHLAPSELMRVKAVMQKIDSGNMSDSVVSQESNTERVKVLPDCFRPSPLQGVTAEMPSSAGAPDLPACFRPIDKSNPLVPAGVPTPNQKKRKQSTLKKRQHIESENAKKSPIQTCVLRFPQLYPSQKTPISS